MTLSTNVTQQQDIDAFLTTYPQHLSLLNS
jgi:hypothetical protein